MKRTAGYVRQVCLNPKYLALGVREIPQTLDGEVLVLIYESPVGGKRYANQVILPVEFIDRFTGGQGEFLRDAYEGLREAVRQVVHEKHEKYESAG